MKQPIRALQAAGLEVNPLKTLLRFLTTVAVRRNEEFNLLEVYPLMARYTEAVCRQCRREGAGKTVS